MYVWIWVVLMVEIWSGCGVPMVLGLDSSWGSPLDQVQVSDLERARLELE